MPPLLRLAAAGLAAAALLPAGPGPVRAEGPRPARPRPLRLSPRPRPALLDCRSPVIPHEVRLAEETPWALGDASIVVRRRGGKWEAEVSRPGDPSPDRRTLARLPALLEVEAFGGAYGLSIRASSDGERLFVASAQGAPVAVGKETAWVVDSDRDGVLGGAGDGLIVPGARTVAPFAGEVWHRDAAVRLARAAGGAAEDWTVEDLPAPYPDRPDHSAAWRLLNWRRQQVGVRPLVHDAALEEGIRRHASYCRRNGYQGHDEEKSKPGWSAEGEEAGRSSVLNYPGPRATLLDEVATQLATLYHRNGVLAGGLVRSALVLQEGMFGMRTAVDPDAPLALAPVLFPPHGMEDAPRRFHPPGEHPPPWEGGIAAGNRGPSVGVALPELRWVEELPGVPMVLVEPAKGTALAGDFHYPGRAPSRVQKDNFTAIALTPTSPLAPATLHRARVLVPLPVGEDDPPAAFEYEWEFTTGP